MIVEALPISSANTSAERNYLYIDTSSQITQFSNLFEIRDFQHININQPLEPGYHHVITSDNTPEYLIRAIGWRETKEAKVRIRRLSLPLKFSSEEVDREFLATLPDLSSDFKQWCESVDETKISIKEAAKIAECAIALLPETQKLIELEVLQQRCGCNNYRWSKIVGSIERDFYQELQRRGIKSPLTNDKDKDEKLRLSLLALINESDLTRKVRKRAEICSYYRISKSEVDLLLQALKAQTEEEQANTYDFEDLLKLESGSLSWLVPELLPKGETVILSGAPKVGKTLLAFDLAFAVATGEDSFLGHGTGERKKVLLVCPDQSKRSTRDKLLKRGFRAHDKEYLKVMPKWTINQLESLEEQIEDYRPDLVVVDSLRRVTHGVAVSENSAEFADIIVTIKETIERYGASGILIHHNNKNADALGVGKIRGSSTIPAATWGSWQIDHMPITDPNNKKRLVIDPSSPLRVFSLHARDTEGQKFQMKLNAENFSWERLDVEEQEEKSTYRQRILNILKKHPQGLSGKEIIELMDSGEVKKHSVYNELNRMTSKRLINCSPASKDKRVNIYSVPIEQIEDTPPPRQHDSQAKLIPETIDMTTLENSNINSNVVENDSNVTNNQVNTPNCSKPVVERNSEVVINPNVNKGGVGYEQTSTDTENIQSRAKDTQPKYQSGDEVEFYPTAESWDRYQGTIKSIDYSNSFSATITFTCKQGKTRSTTLIDASLIVGLVGN